MHNAFVLLTSSRGGRPSAQLERESQGYCAEGEITCYGPEGRMGATLQVPGPPSARRATSSSERRGCGGEGVRRNYPEVVGYLDQYSLGFGTRRLRSVEAVAEPLTEDPLRSDFLRVEVLRVLHCTKPKASLSRRRSWEWNRHRGYARAVYNDDCTDYLHCDRVVPGRLFRPLRSELSSFVNLYYGIISVDYDRPVAISNNFHCNSSFCPSGA